MTWRPLPGSAQEHAHHSPDVERTDVWNLCTGTAIGRRELGHVLFPALAQTIANAGVRHSDRRGKLMRRIVRWKHCDSNQSWLPSNCSYHANYLPRPNTEMASASRRADYQFTQLFVPNVPPSKARDFRFSSPRFRIRAMLARKKEVHT
jgi:hypothetical protein